jgi:Ca2+-binding EF-hand superfamily protein
MVSLVPWKGYAGSTPSVAGKVGVPVDTNGDGFVDSTGYDTTGDGIIDALDTNGDGHIDTAIVVKPSSTSDDSLRGAMNLHHQTEERANQVFAIIDANGDGLVSKLELFVAMLRNRAVDEFITPRCNGRASISDENSFDVVHALFDAIGSGSFRISRQDFVNHFCRVKRTLHNTTGDTEKLRIPFDLIDADCKGTFSNFELLMALQRHSAVADLLLPGVQRSNILRDDTCFDAANAVWDAMAEGKRRVDFAGFVAYVHEMEAAKMPQRKQKTVATKKASKPHNDKPRHEQRVLIISPGFGRLINPAQAELVEKAGFQIQYVNVPNPEEAGFPMMTYLPQVMEAIDKFKPDVLLAASKGGAYVVSLWEMGWWCGHTLMINAHPQLTKLPKGASVVIAHGSNDELYVRSRADLERLIATGSPGKCFLYYTANSGRFSGGFTRMGDQHNQASLLHYDCLPRLIDAAACESGPEVHMIASWQQRLGQDRVEAEQWLSHCPEQLRERWASMDHMGMDSKKLYEVPHNSDELLKVATIFGAAPAEEPTYQGMSDAEWSRTTVVRVERVENGLLEQSENAYYECLQRSIESQGLSFQPGIHSRWAFHGTEQIESIIEDPITGFQPLASGTRLGSLWGSGTYFARDARYVADGNFCRQARDGTRQMLLCLLMTGIPCLGDPEHHGVLPFRQKPHRYNCSASAGTGP